ncbi:MAG: peptidase M42 [Sulfurimonas sp.]|jgi:putative aminopeptidase FrvX|nr:peptidase M42 [Sulfurimonas sp.]
MKKHEAFLDILKQLIRTPSVVGAEHPFFMSVKRELEERNIEVTYYEGLLVAKGSDPKSGYISAHADRHGLVCTGPNEFQYSAFIAQNRGELTGNSVSEELLNDITDRFHMQKVQAYEPWSGIYMGYGVIERSYICKKRGNLVFEISGLEHLIPNIPVAFMDKLSIEKDLISAQLDNVISVAIIIYLYQLGYKGTAFFSASEEAAKSWRFTLEWFMRFDISTDQLLVLDTSPFPTIEEVLAQDIVLRNEDTSAQFLSDLNAKITKICDAKKISYRFKDEYIKEYNKKNNTAKSLGRTELGRIINGSNGRIQGTTLQVPTSGYHTVEETASIKSVMKLISVLEEIYC